MSRYREPQLQETENSCYLWKLSPRIYQSFKIESIFYFKQLVIQVPLKTQNVYCSRHQWCMGKGVLTELLQRLYERHTNAQVQFCFVVRKLLRIKRNKAKRNKTNYVKKPTKIVRAPLEHPRNYVCSQICLCQSLIMNSYSVLRSSKSILRQPYDDDRLPWGVGRVSRVFRHFQALFNCTNLRTEYDFYFFLKISGTAFEPRYNSI